MTVSEYIKAIKSASSSEEILSLWTSVATEAHLTLNDIISVHRSCGKIVTDAALDIKEREGESFRITMK